MFTCFFFHFRRRASGVLNINVFFVHTCVFLVAYIFILPPYYVFHFIRCWISKLKVVVYVEAT